MSVLSDLDSIMTVTLSTNNMFLVSGSTDGTVKIFELFNESLFHEFYTAHNGKNFQPDNSSNNDDITRCGQFCEAYCR